MQQLRFVGLDAERDDRTFRPPADRSRDVQSGAGRRAARENEPAQRWQFAIEAVDPSSRRETSSAVINALVTRPAIRCDGSASRAPIANRSR